MDGVLPFVVHHAKVLQRDLYLRASALAQTRVKRMDVLIAIHGDTPADAVIDAVDGILRRIARRLGRPVDVVVIHHGVFRTVDDLQHVVSIGIHKSQTHLVEDMLLLLVGQDGLGQGTAMLGLTRDAVLELDIKELLAMLPFEQHVDMVQNLLIPSGLAKVFVAEVLLVLLLLGVHPN